MMTEQEVFTTAYLALRERGFTRAGVDDGNGDFRCAYRAPDGRRCAIGLFITDEEYENIEEGAGVYTVIDSIAALKGIPHYFLDDLQLAHDEGNTPQRMERGLRMVADRYGLEIPA